MKTQISGLRDATTDGQLLHQIVKLCWWAYPGRWDAGPLGRPRERQQQPRKQQRQRVLASTCFSVIVVRPLSQRRTVLVSACAEHWQH